MRQFMARMKRLFALDLTKLCLVILLGAFVFGAGFMQPAGWQEKDQWKTRSAQSILETGWAILQEPTGWKETLWQFCFGYVPTNPYSQLAAGIPYLTEDEIKTIKWVEEEEEFQAASMVGAQWNFPMDKLTEATLSDEVEVILYHTHNAETYAPSAGTSKVTGENGGVATAAEILKNALEVKYGIRTLHNLTLHDYPDWSRSYNNSLATAKNLLAGNPNAKAIFDVHRDAGFTSKKPTTISINGKDAAKIMIVLGANHENWKQNLAFAQALQDKADKLYPGLVRDLRIAQSSRYNQQLMPHALLLEIGSDLNTQEEANYSMECFAQVIAEVLKDG